MTVDEGIAGVNRALDRCDARSRKDGQIRWSIAICILLGIKARLIMDECLLLTGGMEEQ